MIYLYAMEYFIAGNILDGSNELPKIEIGDVVMYDKKLTERNGRFKTLEEFKQWMTDNFEFEHQSGEEYENSICRYLVHEVKNGHIQT